MACKYLRSKETKKINILLKVHIPLFIILTSILCGCTSMEWNDAILQLEDKELEIKYNKEQVLKFEHKKDSLLSAINDLSDKINKCGNDIAETKFCLNYNYDKRSDTSLIFIKTDKKITTDTSYITCCTGYRQRFRLRRDDFDVLQSIFDQITIDNNKLNSRLHNLKAENDSLIKLIELNRNILSNCENNLYNLLNGNKEMLNEFREEFSKIEKFIGGKEGSRNERNELLSQIAANRFVCLPEFRERFKGMKKREGQ